MPKTVAGFETLLSTVEPSVLLPGRETLAWEAHVFPSGLPEGGHCRARWVLSIVNIQILRARPNKLHRSVPSEPCRHESVRGVLFGSVV